MDFFNPVYTMQWMLYVRALWLVIALELLVKSTDDFKKILKDI